MKAFFKWMGVILLLTVMISCQFDNGETEDVFYKKVSISINEPGRSNSFTGAPPRSEALTSSNSVVLAFPSGVTAVDQSLDFTTAFDRQLFDTSDNTVSLLVPLNTPMQLVKANYGSAITLAVFDLQSTPPLATGLSDVFTISGGTTEKAITVTMSSQAAFQVSSTSPADAATGAAINTFISITFGEAMATSGISVNTSGTNCGTHIKVSADDFSTCVEMAGSPVYSNSDQTLTLTTTAALSPSTTYKIRVSTDTKNASGEDMGYIYTSTTGFTTANTLLIGGTIQTQALSLSTTPASNTVTVFAGDGSAATTPGPGTSAALNGPYGMATDGENLFVTEFAGNHILKVKISNADVSTLAGTGTAGLNNAALLSATFDGPAAIATNGSAKLWVADANNNVIREINRFTEQVTTLAGGGTGGGNCGGNDATCQDGVGTAAEFNVPYGITYHNGFLYVADRDNHRIRKIDVSDGTVTTVAGGATGGGNCGGNDGTCQNNVGALAEFNSPTSVSTNGTYVFVSDMTNYRIRRVTISDGTVTTIAGDGTAPFIAFPRGVGTDGTNVFATEIAASPRIRTFLTTDSPGSEQTIVGGAGSGCAAGPWTGATAQFDTAKGTVSNGTSLFVAVQVCNRIYKID
jgi:hypothetical protein